jgi:hypothetical protein
MEKRADSLRSQGFTTIATDIPTKVKLQAAANSQGLTLAEWLRYLANLSIDGGKQGQLPAISAPVNSSVMAIQRIENFENKLDIFLERLSHYTSDKAIASLWSNMVNPDHISREEQKANLNSFIDKVQDIVKHPGADIVHES